MLAQNVIQLENLKTGNPASEWDISGAGDLSIQGFSTDISVNKGSTVRFKVNVTGTNKSFGIRIYRLGYYQGNGARLIANLGSFTGVTQPSPLTQASTGLIDCGNWSQTATWLVPGDAVSGIYIARLTRADNQGASHIVFIVRDDASAADILFKTSDATWQAYNAYGGNSLYLGNTPGYPAGHAVKVSYNRPFLTRNGGGGGGPAMDWLFNAEYPMVRWLERNGYSVTYTTDVDMDRDQIAITPSRYKAIFSVGHDEYWSLRERNRVEAARNAGVHLAFFSGNEVYWKTRWENSIDASNTTYRTLVCYKEGTLGENICNGECDPSPEWTGLWRDGCEATGASDGCRPENGLSGQISWTESTTSILVPGVYRRFRIWRNTAVANLTDLQTHALPVGTLGYEWNYEQSQYASSNPAQRVTLSSTEQAGKVHKLSFYRHSSGAIVFGAGTVQWSWGLDASHDRGNEPASPVLQQATLNLLAEMGIQPASIQSGLVGATASSDVQVPAATIQSPLNGAAGSIGAPIRISGTASDLGGGTIAMVEVSFDNGMSWTSVNGTSNWFYDWTPSAAGAINIRVRAIDDNGNAQPAGAIPSQNAITVNISGSSTSGNCPCTILTSSQISQASSSVSGNDGTGGISLGTKFRASVNGQVTALRFYKSASNTGTHIGQLWRSDGTLLGQATYVNETASGWQQVQLATPVSITAGQTYVVSYHSSAGNYSSTNNYFNSTTANGPLKNLANGEDGLNGVYRYTNTPAFPSSSYQSSSYWVDIVFATAPAGPDQTPPQLLSVNPLRDAAGVPVNSTVTAGFNEALMASSVTGSSVFLRTGSTTVAASVSYAAGGVDIVLTPSVPLQASTLYTVTLKGGTGTDRIRDVAGNALAADTSWSFTTAAAQATLPNPRQGPDGPILVIRNATNGFTEYYAEILRAEGLNEFLIVDINAVNATLLNKYDVVILGDFSITNAQVNTLTTWVNNGGKLIAFRPRSNLFSLMGIGSASGTLSDRYLLVQNLGPGFGIVSESIQYHGTSSNYTLNGATSLATIYSNASTATTYPAVTTRSVGSNGGRAIAFAFDLARSIVYTRQGNPAWAGQKRDGQSGPIRSDDLFYPSWIDLSKVAIPQADEQQRLLTNIILQENSMRKPLPRFWFLPSQHKAAIVMTGDDHATGGTAGRFNRYVQFGNNTTADIENWKSVRSTSYIYSGMPTGALSNAQATSFVQQGFEISLHLNTGCSNYTESSLLSAFNAQLGEWTSKYPGVYAPVTHRTHCLAWSDWDSKPKVEVQKGIRLNTDYYYWPGTWIQNRPGMFTGSGMPMRYAALDGSILDNYQVTTQMPDESGITFPGFIDALLDNATGPNGYYGVFCANMHADYNGTGVPGWDGGEAIIASAKARGVPVVSAKQMLDWLDGRNNSNFTNIAWLSNNLSFTVNTWGGVKNLVSMLPVNFGSGLKLVSISFNGQGIAFNKEVIKGIEYAFFNALPGSYVASYQNVSSAANGVVSELQTEDQSAVKPGDEEDHRLRFFLGQNYPNPARNLTTIAYRTPQNGQVSVLLFDLQGRVVLEVVNQYKRAGTHFANIDVSKLSAGIYYYQIRTGDRNAIRKMVVER